MAEIKYLVHLNLNDQELQNVKLQHLNADPTAVEGKIFYHSGSNVIKFHNGSDWIALSAATGDITSVVAGAGLTGGATDGDATLNVVGGTGITANADDIQITDGGVGTTQLANDGVTADKLANSINSAIAANTAKNTNVSTNLGVSTSTTTVTVTSSDGDNATIPVATTSIGGVMSKAMFDEHTANNAKNTNVSTNLSIASSTGSRTIASSDGTNATIPVATTSVSGVMSTAIFDAVTANTAKTSNVTHTGDVTGSGALTIAADAVTYAKMQNLGTANRVLGSTSTGVIGETQIVEAMIANDAVTADKIANSINSAIAANTAKNTNVSTNLGISGSTGARTITSSDGNNAVIPVATTSVSGVMSPTIFDAVTANSAKVTNTDVDVSVANLKTRLAGGFAGNAVTIGDSNDVVTIGNDLTVTGDLIVSGATTTVNTATLSVEDPLIEMSRGNGANLVDIGIYGRYVAEGTKYSGLFRDASDNNIWKFFNTTGNSNASPAAATTIDTSSGFTYANVRAGTFYGALSGNATTATTLATPRAINGTNFDGSSAITITAAGSTLTGTSLKSTIVSSSLTSVGTIGTGVWQGTAIATAYIADDAVTADKLANSINSAIAANTSKNTNVSTNLSSSTHASQITINSSDGNNVVIAEASGTIAGVMTVAHHDKLDGIESNATADQSNAEIRAAVEAASDSNVFTDADHSKLNGIESSATADQSKSDIEGLAIQTVGAITSGSWTATDVAVAHGGTGASSASAARTNLGVAYANDAETLAASSSTKVVTPAGLKARSFKGTYGGATTINVDHGLGTRDVIVQLYDASSYETVYAEVARPLTTRVTLKFNSAPASNDIIALVTKVD